MKNKIKCAKELNKVLGLSPALPTDESVSESVLDKKLKKAASMLTETEIEELSEVSKKALHELGWEGVDSYFLSPSEEKALEEYENPTKSQKEKGKKKSEPEEDEEDEDEEPEEDETEEDETEEDEPEEDEKPVKSQKEKGKKKSEPEEDEEDEDEKPVKSKKEKETGIIKTKKEKKESGFYSRITVMAEVLKKNPNMDRREAIKKADSLYFEKTGKESNVKAQSFLYKPVLEVMRVFELL